MNPDDVNDYNQSEVELVSPDSFVQAITTAMQIPQTNNTPYQELESEIVVIENIIQAFILKETKLLEHRDAMKRIIRYENKQELHKRLNTKYNKYQFEKMTEDALRDEIMTDLESRLKLSNMTLGIRVMREAKESLLLAKRSLYEHR